MLRLRAPTSREGMAWFLQSRRTLELSFDYKSTSPFLFEWRSGFFLFTLSVPEEVAKTMTSKWNIPAC
jgi:hypothetical protein